MYRNKFKTIIDKYPDIWNYDHLFKAVLMDIYPEDKLLRNLLRASVEEQIPYRLKELNSISNKERYELSKSMMDAYDCSEEKADLVVELWIDAFGLELNEKLSNDIIAGYSIEELDLSARTYNALKRAGIDVVADIMRPREEEGRMCARNLSRLALDEFYKKIKELGWKEEKESYHEKNYPGRAKCDKLREIRKKIANANDIYFEPAECHHTGPCLGTCPACDAEIRYLDRQIRLKKQRGEEVVLTGIASNDIKKSGLDVDSEVDVEPNCIVGGLIEPGGIEDPWDIGVDLNKDNKTSETEDIVMGELSPIVMGEDVFLDTDLEDVW